MSDFYIICGLAYLIIVGAWFALDVTDKLPRRRSSRDWRGSWTDEDGEIL